MIKKAAVWVLAVRLSALDLMPAAALEARPFIKGAGREDALIGTDGSF